jgi:molybdenum cofactor biosynthesis protein B
VLTISDTRTEANDTSGDAIVELLTGAGQAVVGRRIVRDDPAAVREAVQSGMSTAEVAITTGGTGITARDSTYEAISALLDERLDGFGELFRMLMLQFLTDPAGSSRGPIHPCDRTDRHSTALT